uniref:Uncharacterized protein n=1 Tax=Arundo donax TaxID=35708 RepID=A0A0A9A5B9_ARUDO
MQMGIFCSELKGTIARAASYSSHWILITHSKRANKFTFINGDNKDMFLTTSSIINHLIWYLYNIKETKMTEFALYCSTFQ